MNQPQRPSDEAAASPRYDEFPYLGAAYAQSHPWRLGALAHLHRLTAPDPRGARVLELGCGDGTNLLSIAATLPGSLCIGIDASAVAIAVAEEVQAEAGIPNCSFRAADLLEVDGLELADSADFVIAHGLLSWVPAEVRERAIALAGQALAPGGLLVVTYNALPGWNLLRGPRQIARRAVAAAGDGLDLDESAATAIAALREAVELHGADDAYGAALRLALERYEAADPFLLFHDDLADGVEPLDLSYVAGLAAANGLSYLDEAAPDHWWPSRLPARSAERIRGAGSGALDRQLAADLVSGVVFKATAFVKGATALEPEAVPARALDLHLRRRPEAEPPPEGTAPAVLAAWEALGELGVAGTTGSVAAASAGLDPEAAGSAFLRLAAELRIDLTLGAPEFATSVGERPTTSPLIRALAARGALVPALTHETIRLGDPASRAVVQLLDGSRDREAIARDLAASGTVATDAEQIVAVLGDQLTPLAERGLISA